VRSRERPTRAATWVEPRNRCRAISRLMARSPSVRRNAGEAAKALSMGLDMIGVGHALELYQLRFRVTVRDASRSEVLPTQNLVRSASGSGLPATSHLKVGRDRHAHRSDDNNLQSAFHDRIALRHIDRRRRSPVF